jgi:hypothetical protein
MMRLHVPGLAEKRPSVMRCDIVLATPSLERNSKGVYYAGVVHVVEQVALLLKFDPDFKPFFPVNIVFRYPRRTMNILHQSLDLLRGAASIHPDNCCLKVLYPSASKHVPPSPPILTNTTMPGLNHEQTRAVISIVQRAANIDKFPAPYTIFGPPGTGKVNIT